MLLYEASNIEEPCAGKSHAGICEGCQVTGSSTLMLYKENMITLRTQYAPGDCLHKEKYREIRWDVVGCNLRCHFCWSPASRPTETGVQSINLTPDDIYDETVRHLTTPENTFIRFTGGEPTLFWPDISEFLDMFHSLDNEKRVPILFQTNGIEIGKGNVDLDILGGNSNQNYLFELSMKGTNSSEFEILTARPKDLYHYQLDGYNALKNISKKYNNIRVVAVLGVYHSAVGRPSKYAFINPQTSEVLFESYERWDDRFKAIWEGTDLKWVEPLRRSPLGCWNNIKRRCMENGAGILKEFPMGADTNRKRLFPKKPKSFDYARDIVTKQYWK